MNAVTSSHTQDMGQPDQKMACFPIGGIGGRQSASHRDRQEYGVGRLIAGHPGGVWLALDCNSQRQPKGTSHDNRRQDYALQPFGKVL